MGQVRRKSEGEVTKRDTHQPSFKSHLDILPTTWARSKEKTRLGLSIGGGGGGGAVKKKNRGIGAFERESHVPPRASI